MIKNKNVKKKTKKDKIIPIRINSLEKERLKHNAKKEGMTLSEYLINAGLTGGKKSPINIHHILAHINDICNYVEEEYPEDKNIRKLEEELWELL